MQASTDVMQLSLPMMLPLILNFDATFLTHDATFLTHDAIFLIHDATFLCPSTDVSL